MNEQEQFWAGEFGDAYTERSKGRVAANLAFFARVLGRCGELRSAIEFGAGAGENLIAIRHLLPEVELTAVEINKKALRCLQGRADSVVEGSMLEFRSGLKRDLAFTKGVLIHVAPEDLFQAYDVLHRASGRYILVAEYYNPTPLEVEYRGHAGKLWKRDFAGDMLDRYPDLRLVDYGFVWKRDQFPQDDVTWFLMEKR